MLIKVKISIFAHILIKMVKRTSKEYSIKNDNFKIKTKYGTLNKNNPNIIYLRSKTKVKSLNKDKDYKEELKNINIFFQKYVKTIINETNLFNNHICTFETPEKGIIFNKISNLKYDLYLQPKTIKDMCEYENDITLLTNKANKKLLELCEKYNIELV